MSLTAAWKWSSSDAALHCLPLHHIHGIVNILYCALAARARIVFSSKFDAAKILAKVCVCVCVVLAMICVRACVHVCACVSHVERKWQTDRQND